MKFTCDKNLTAMLHIRQWFCRAQVWNVHTHFCRSILIMVSLSFSSAFAAGPKMLECWFQATYGDSGLISEHGYDITYDLGTKSAEITYTQKDPLKAPAPVYAAKIDEFPNTLRFIFDTTSVFGGGITTLDVDRKSLNANLETKAALKKGTGKCSIKKLAVKPNKI